MDSEQAKMAITDWAREKGWGEKTVSYRLRDWCISRQRYWGNPIPVIHCPHCGIVLVPDEDLPVKLPDNVQVGRTTKNPLLSVPEWINVPCPKCGTPAKRETDTMDTFVDSSWYYARYTDPNNDREPFSKELADYWLPVDQYIGGIEHACMHLLYARFFHKFMRDLGWVNCDEPFARLLTQGMVTKDGAKMSKSKGNVVDPQYIIDRFGADTLRTFLLFASPPEKDVEWSDDGIMGAFRFLNRVWRLVESNRETIKRGLHTGESSEPLSEEIYNLRYETHYAIFRWREDCLERLQFNTAIASCMEFLNAIAKIKEPDKLNSAELRIYAFACVTLPKMLYPFAPHIAEELWQILGNEKMLNECGLPEYEEKYLTRNNVTYVVQVNGKIRGKLEVPIDINTEDLKTKAMEIENVQRFLQGLNIKKIIVVPGKMVSIAAGK